MRTRIAILVVAALCWTIGAQATIYNAADQFSPDTNPNGVWSYGYYTTASTGDPASFTQYTIYGKALDNDLQPTELDAWKYDENGWSNIIHNPTDHSITEYEDKITWAPNALSLFSNDNSKGYAVVRWTAPMDGTVDISTAWTPIYTGANWATEYTILGHEGSFTVLNNFTQTDYGTYLWSTVGLAVSAGDTVDFAIVNQQVTQLDATITMVPEPSMLALLAAGLFGLLAYAWRKRR